MSLHYTICYTAFVLDATLPCEEIVEKIKKLVGEPRNYGT